MRPPRSLFIGRDTYLRAHYSLDRGDLHCVYVKRASFTLRDKSFEQNWSQLLVRQGCEIVS